MSEASFGRYRLLDLLGGGDTGQVYRAFDAETNRVVALKVRPRQPADDLEFERRFRRETEILAALDNPHIVPVHHFGEADGRFYVDMRLIEGRDLATVITGAGGRLSAARTVPIIEQVAAALDTAHRAGLVHRNLKPSDILLTERDFAYLVGFGITWADARYPAPEGVSGTAGIPADVYSLTCVLYQCLTGRPPFDGTGPAELTASPAQPSATYPDVPSGFDYVVARGLAKNPAERYQTAPELAAASRAVLEGAFAGVTPPSSTTPPPVVPYTAYPVGGITPSRPSLAAPILVVSLLAVLLVGYVLAAVLTRSLWLGTGAQDGTAVTFTAEALDGSPPSPDALSQTRDMVAARTHELGYPNAQVTSEGDTVTVTAPGDGSEIGGVAEIGQLYVRPVIYAMPATPATTTPSAPAPSGSGQAQHIADEKQLRQSTDRQIQVLALQFQATRCMETDVLAGHDDPDLPLITCAEDDSQVYLLDKAIIGSEQIEDASSGLDEQRGEHVVDLEFTGDATDTWADFTAANIGTQTAFVLDTKVVSAPEIVEPIPGGRTQITGRFTAADARALASVLSHETLPLRLTFESSRPETVAGQPGSTPLRIGLLAFGVVLVSAFVGAVVFLVRRTSSRGAVG